MISESRVLNKLTVKYRRFVESLPFIIENYPYPYPYPYPYIYEEYKGKKTRI